MIPAQTSLQLLNSKSANTMVEYLGIQFTALGSDFIEATMPVDHRTRQPYGILHGGASVTLAESLGSIGSSLCVDPALYRVAGLEINANHVSSVVEGVVTGRAQLVHEGRSTHIWDIRIHQEDKLVCISRLTVTILNRKIS